MLDEKDLLAIAQIMDVKLAKQKEEILAEMGQQKEELISMMAQQKKDILAETSSMMAQQKKEILAETSSMMAQQKEEILAETSSMMAQQKEEILAETSSMMAQQKKEILTESAQNTMVLMEAYFDPKFNLLAEEVQYIKENMVTRQEFEDFKDEVQEDINYLNFAVRTLFSEINELKQAQ